MDTAETFVLIGGTLLIAFTLWFFFGKREEEAATVTADGLPLYECPMHPWITSTDPTANCSLCGMKLVRRGDAGAKHNALEQGHNAPQGHNAEPDHGSHSTHEPHSQTSPPAQPGSHAAPSAQPPHGSHLHH